MTLDPAQAGAGLCVNVGMCHERCHVDLRMGWKSDAKTLGVAVTCHKHTPLIEVFLLHIWIGSMKKVSSWCNEHPMKTNCTVLLCE